MRPTRLELEGFISFRERTEIDFSSLDLFGITGPTGAGKTALIDGMIFALYGKTPRLGEKVVQELISQGSAQLRVLLEFECGDVQYRVLRIVKRKGPGRTQIERKRDNEWEPIAASTRELRKRVEEIIGLDFDGFTKTVVLPQGQFDRFLRGDGAARRKILSDLLGLDVYEQMMKRANEIARDANRQCDVLTEMAEQQYGAATPERMLELDASIAQTAVERERAASNVGALEKALPLVIQLRQTEADFAEYRSEQVRLRKALETAAAQVAVVKRKIDKLRLDVASAGYDAQRHLAVTSMLPVARRQAELKRAIHAVMERGRQEAEAADRLLRETEAARAAWGVGAGNLDRAAAQAKQAEDAWQAFRAKHGSADLLAGAARDAAGYARVLKSIEALRLEAELMIEAIQRAKDEALVLTKQDAAAAARVADERRNLDRLRALHAAAGVRQLLAKGEPCPVCLHIVGELPAGGDGHARLSVSEKNLAAAEGERERLRTKVAANRLELDTLPKKLQSDKERLEQLEQKRLAIEAAVERLAGGPLRHDQDPAAVLAELASRAKTIETQAAQAAKALRSATATESTLRQALHESETRLALVRQASANTARELEEKRAELTDGGAELAVLEAETHALGKARDLHERLAREQAEAERISNRAEVDERSISERLASVEASLAGLSERAEALRSQLEGVPLDGRMEQRLAEVRERLRTIDSTLAAAQLAHRSLEDQVKEAEELARRVFVLEKEGAVYSKLGTMLRTDQFVAWILKDAFARLAYEGSRQLEALSNGRYTFAAGGDDFAVCDRWNAGERRSVNTLSGGESFLASLSLALALSRGLPEFAANRERFHLDSLFLDEGFSTLDAETLDTVLGAVEMLQSDCRLIGVISHAPELAERLPGRIEVVKGANGSRVIVR